MIIWYFRKVVASFCGHENVKFLNYGHFMNFWLVTFFVTTKSVRVPYLFSGARWEVYYEVKKMFSARSSRGSIFRIKAILAFKASKGQMNN